MDLLCHLFFFSHGFIFFLFPLSIFPFYPSYMYSQVDPPLLTVCNQSQPPFNTASVISPNPDIIGSLDARTTPSLLGTKEWANNPSRFHPGCRFEVSELLREEFSVEIGGGSTFFSFAGDEISTDDGGVHQFGLDLYISCVVFGLPLLGPMYWLLLYPLWVISVMLG